MAGTKTGEFRELISPFLKAKLAEIERVDGVDSAAYRAIARQYVTSPFEKLVGAQERLRHYQSMVAIEFDGRPVIGVERLYRRTVLIEPTTVCAAHCRWCLRGQYPVATMTGDDIAHAARYFGSAALRDDVEEVLVTGGDPLMAPGLLGHTIDSLMRHAPNVRTIRIGTRVPFQDPQRIDEELVELLRGRDGVSFELGVNVNHPVEFWPESVAALERLRDAGVRLYNQHPLLKGVNDDLATLIELYGLLRRHHIEAHYLFHAIPLRGMSHHRTSIRHGLDLITRLSACGEFSGRAKPRFAVLSDIGKIVLYHGSVVERRASDNAVLLRSGFSIEDRRRWCPGWQTPDSVVLANDGTMLTWYLDGPDEALDADVVTRAS